MRLEPLLSNRSSSDEESSDSDSSDGGSPPVGSGGGRKSAGSSRLMTPTHRPGHRLSVPPTVVADGPVWPNLISLDKDGDWSFPEVTVNFYRM